MADISVEEVRKQILMFTTVLQSVLTWMPGEANAKLKKVSELVIGLTSQEWFAGMVAYLLNTFKDNPISKENLSEALAHFAASVKESKQLPVKFDLK